MLATDSPNTLPVPVKTIDPPQSPRLNANETPMTGIRHESWLDKRSEYIGRCMRAPTAACTLSLKIRRVQTASRFPRPTSLPPLCLADNPRYVRLSFDGSLTWFSDAQSETSVKGSLNLVGAEATAQDVIGEDADLDPTRPTPLLVLQAPQRGTAPAVFRCTSSSQRDAWVAAVNEIAATATTEKVRVEEAKKAAEEAKKAAEEAKKAAEEAKRVAAKEAKAKAAEEKARRTPPAAANGKVEKAEKKLIFGKLTLDSPTTFLGWGSTAASAPTVWEATLDRIAISIAHPIAPSGCPPSHLPSMPIRLQVSEDSTGRGTLEGGEAPVTHEHLVTAEVAKFATAEREAVRRALSAREADADAAATRGRAADEAVRLAREEKASATSRVDAAREALDDSATAARQHGAALGALAAEASQARTVLEAAQDQARCVGERLGAEAGQTAAKVATRRTERAGLAVKHRGERQALDEQLSSAKAAEAAAAGQLGVATTMLSLQRASLAPLEAKLAELHSEHAAAQATLEGQQARPPPPRPPLGLPLLTPSLASPLLIFRWCLPSHPPMASPSLSPPLQALLESSRAQHGAVAAEVAAAEAAAEALRSRIVSTEAIDREAAVLARAHVARLEGDLAAATSLSRLQASYASTKPPAPAAEESATPPDATADSDGGHDGAAPDGTAFASSERLSVSAFETADRMAEEAAAAAAEAEAAEAEAAAASAAEAADAEAASEPAGRGFDDALAAFARSQRVVATLETQLGERKSHELARAEQAGAELLATRAQAAAGALALTHKRTHLDELQAALGELEAEAACTERTLAHAALAMAAVASSLSSRRDEVARLEQQSASEGSAHDAAVGAVGALEAQAKALTAAHTQALAAADSLIAEEEAFAGSMHAKAAAAALVKLARGGGDASASGAAAAIDIPQLLGTALAEAEAELGALVAERAKLLDGHAKLLESLDARAAESRAAASAAATLSAAHGRARATLERYDASLGAF